MSDNFVSLKEACSLVKESDSTIRRLIWDGKIPSRKEGNGKKVKYFVDKTSLFQRCERIDVKEDGNSKLSNLNINGWQKSLDEKTGEIILLHKQLNDQRLLLQTSEDEQEKMKIRAENEKEKMELHFKHEKEKIEDKFKLEKDEFDRDKEKALRNMKIKNYVILIMVFILCFVCGIVAYLLNPSLFSFFNF